jgi:hypothetical protein
MEYPVGFFDRSSIDLTIALILASTGQQLDPDEVVFGQARALDPIPTNDNDPNTYIPVTFINNTNSQFNGVNGFLYRRARFPEARVSDMGNFTGYPTTLHKLLATINLKCNTQITPLDVLDAVIDTPVESVRLVAAPNSPNYFGVGDLYLVERVLTQPELDGFHEWKA